MTKLFNLSNIIARQLKELKRQNKTLSYSDIIGIVLKDFDHDSIDTLLVNQVLFELDGKLPNLTEEDLIRIQILIIQLTKLKSDQLELAREGLLKFITDLSNIPTEMD